MNEQIDIWLVGNTGLRNPNRIQDGFKVFAGSPFVGSLHGKDNEIGFMNYLNEKEIIQNEDGKDESGSHARKWRLMFAKNGFIYPQVKKKDGKQEELGPLDDITPFGRSFLKADTYPAVQECYLRAMSVEQFVMPDGIHYFSPLRWLLAIMLELEKRTGTSELSRIEFALWGHTTNPSYNLSDVVDRILDLRKRRAAAPAKRPFDKKEIAKRGKSYDKKADNFLDYSDMNMRYLRISGVLQRKGRGLIIVPAKHVMAEKLAKSTASAEPIMEQYKLLCNGAPLPTDNVEVAKSLLDDLIKQMKERHIAFDISDLPLTTSAEINIARQRLENILAQTDEIQYANDQCNQWKEIADYMSLLIKGGGKQVYDEDNAIEVPKDETPAYLEWTLWRAALAIDHMVNKPYEVRGFKLDADFMPVSAAGGGKGDLYCEFNDFTILTEVTMSTSSRQEAMEGEPVRRHVSDAVLKYEKPVYGMFIAVKIDTNTAETFRHGVWYANATPLDAQNIFSRINRGGTQLKAEELLSAKPYWNKSVNLVEQAVVDRIKEMYKNLGIPAPDSIVRWDIAATFISRIKDENLIFDTYEDVRRKKEISMDEISLGFKLLSSIYAQGMSNKQVSELEQNESIKWESDIDELLHQLNTVCSILLADTFFKFYQSWKRSITKLMGNAIALEFLTIMWLDWKDRGCPSSVSGETKALQRDARILFDKLVFEYATKTWRGSGDSKMSSDIKNWKQRVTPVDSEDWKNFITGACMGNYNGQDTTIKILKPVLYYYYVITNCSPINQVNVSFDVDHIIPKERFVGNNMVAQTYRDSLINLALLPTKDNISKKAKALNEITDSWLKLQISTYTGIKEAEFEQYSDIANISLLYNARSKLFTIAFTSNRTTALSK